MIPYSSESHKQQYNRTWDVIKLTTNLFSKDNNVKWLRSLYNALCVRRITHTPKRDNKQHFAVKFNGWVDDILTSEQREIIVTFTFNEDDSIKQVEIYLVEMSKNFLGVYHQRLSMLRGFENMKHMKRRPYGTAKLVKSINPDEVHIYRGR